MMRMMLMAAVVLVWSGAAGADMRFEEVSERAGISHRGQTWGASWGDFNGDGWPDIWVGNHNSRPSLYVNQKDGTFSDAITGVWRGDPKTDAHGAAWGDFDNDGDQDLAEVVGAKEMPDGTFCVSCSSNNLYVNEGGRLINRAEELGLDTASRARSVLWVDFDLDGRLDLVVVNSRGGEDPGSQLFHQQGGRFRLANKAFGFRDNRWRRRERYGFIWDNLLDLKYTDLPELSVHRNLEFAQLSDFSGDGALDMILFSSPTRIYSLGSRPFEDLTHTIEFPVIPKIQDAAIADFDGDGAMDLYLARGEYLASDVAQDSATDLRGTLTGPRGGRPRAMRFRSAGDLTITIHPTWTRLDKVKIGAGGFSPETRTFSLSADDASVAGPVEYAEVPATGVRINYDPDSGLWVIKNSLKGEYIDFIIEAEQPIEGLETIAFEPFEPKGGDILLLRRGDAFREHPLKGAAGQDNACFFVTAGDFDNDMDVDLYMTCTGMIGNLPNRLLENDGKGNFTLVAGAGGAEGSMDGRADTVIAADYDRDGFLDLFVTNGTDPSSPFVWEGPHQLFRNKGNGNHWVELDLVGTESNRDAIGASVVVEAGGRIQVREQGGGMHRMSQNHQRLHFGLGGNPEIDRITIRWPGGRVQTLEDVAADRIIRVVEDAPGK